MTVNNTACETTNMDTLESEEFVGIENIVGEDLYFNEIGKVNILTEDEEKALGERILRGRMAIEAIHKGENNDTLKNLVEDGEEAQKALVERNLRLVAAIARRHVNSKVDYMDLVQEGNLGLITAAYKFDVTKGFRFTTYATNWIRQAIQRAIVSKGRSIRIPSYMYQRICTINKTKLALSNELGREASTKEIAKALGLSEEKVSLALLYSKDIASLDAALVEDSESTLADMVVSENCVSPEDNAIQASVIDIVANALDSLPKREADILRYRFGFYGHPYTLEEIGELYGVTRERVRQIEKKALERIKSKKTIYNDLKDYYDVV